MASTKKDSASGAPKPTKKRKSAEFDAPIAKSKWTLRSIDAALVAAGWPPVSDEWWNVLDRVYASKQRNIVGRWGRRGGKSSTLAGRVAVFEIISGRHEIPPGDVGYFAILSADKDQAKERLDTCSKALSALGIVHRKTATEITIKDSNLGIKAFAATTSAVVSFTCIGFLCDEMAHWRDKDSGANPASSIVKLLRPTMATRPNAKGWYVSAPFSTIDLHHKMFERGETKSQLVFFGTTTQMNPTLTDEMIRELEEDEETRLNAYYCVPLSSDETKFFSAALIDRASQTVFPESGRPSLTAGGADLAFRRNSSALAVLERHEAVVTVIRKKNPVKEYGIKLVADEERIPKPGIPLRPSETIADLMSIARLCGAHGVAADLHYIESLREETDEIEMDLLEFPSDNESISQAYMRFRVMLADDRVDLSEATPKLLEQLKNTTQKPIDGGGLKIIHKEVAGAHGDRVSALICGAWALEQDSLAENATAGARRYSRGEESASEDEIDGLPPASWLE